MSPIRAAGLPDKMVNYDSEDEDIQNQDTRVSLLTKQYLSLNDVYNMDPAKIEGKVLKIRQVDLSRLQKEHDLADDED